MSKNRYIIEVKNNKVSILDNDEELVSNVIFSFLCNTGEDALHLKKQLDTTVSLLNVFDGDLKSMGVHLFP